MNPLGAQLGACTYCGFCEKFGCGNYSKASPQTTILPYLMQKPNFTLKTECEVLRVELTPDRKRATGVTYVNSAGEEYFQPAVSLVFVVRDIAPDIRTSAHADQRRHAIIRETAIAVQFLRIAREGMNKGAVGSDR